MPEITLNKSEQVIAYIIEKHGQSTITELMKESYLIDLVSIKKYHQQVTDFVYRRWNYGPFDQKIYSVIQSLSNKNVILMKNTYVNSSEITSYARNESIELNYSEMSENDIEAADSVLNATSGHGAKMLTELAYDTKPMKALGATLGGNEHMGEILNLNAE